MKAAFRISEAQLAAADFSVHEHDRCVHVALFGEFSEHGHAAGWIQERKGLEQLNGSEISCLGG